MQERPLQPPTGGNPMGVRFAKTGHPVPAISIFVLGRKAAADRTCFADHLDGAIVGVLDPDGTTVT